MRWGLGPVFGYECLIASRRWQTYALRSLAVAALLVAMGTIATASMPTSGNSARDYANLGAGYFVVMIGVNLALVMLAAPGATAGAICVDRARGTLTHMLMTDLSDVEIVLGKLGARLLPVLGLVACTWPVMAISSLLGGIDPVALTLAFAIIFAVAVLGCTTALAISVWARKSHEVILATYTAFILCLLLWPIWELMAMARWLGPAPRWALLANPYYVAFAPYADPGTLTLSDYLVFFGATLAASAVLAILAVWRTRPVACRGSVERKKGPRIGWISRLGHWLPGPSLDGNPVLWREWYRTRSGPWMTAFGVLLMGSTGVLCLVGAVAFWKNGIDFGGTSAPVWQIAGVCSFFLHVCFGLLMLAAIAPTSMAEERQRGSLDILAATSLSTWEIVIGKWLGTFRLALLMAISPGVIALALATARTAKAAAVAAGSRPDYVETILLASRIGGAMLVVATILAHGALLTSIGLAMAVWMQHQARAIAMTIGSYILITVALPIVAAIAFRYADWLAGILGCLSPVAVCGIVLSLLLNRGQNVGSEGGFLWSAVFSTAVIFVAAMGLLWLTVRTFDGCFDRVSGDAHRSATPPSDTMVSAQMDRPQHRAPSKKGA